MRAQVVPEAQQHVRYRWDCSGSRKPEEPAMYTTTTLSFVSIAQARPRVVDPSHVYCIPVVRELPASAAGPDLGSPLTW
jgi:hypothetical protein